MYLLMKRKTEVLYSDEKVIKYVSIKNHGCKPWFFDHYSDYIG